MKVLFMSDLHLDNLAVTTALDGVPHLISYINSLDVDVVVISGDISGDYKTTLNIVEKLNKETKSTVYFGIGNHDIWTNKDKNDSNTSLKAYNSLVESPFCIEGKTIHLTDKTVLVGSMGWYDYSFALPKLDDYVMKTRKKKFGDYTYVNWQYQDKEFFDLQIKQLNSLINSDDLAEKDILLSMHYVPFSEYIHYSEYSNEWNVLNGFFGGYGLGKEILHCKNNLKLVHFGHTHKHKVGAEDGIMLVCKPFGYSFEWAYKNILEQLQYASYIIEVE